MLLSQVTGKILLSVVTGAGKVDYEGQKCVTVTGYR